MHQIVIDDELRRAGVSRPNNPIGIGWAAPTIALAGTEEQKERYLEPIFTGEEFWCQMFSAPDAGSDLATLGTRAEMEAMLEFISTHQLRPVIDSTCALRDGNQALDCMKNHQQFGKLVLDCSES